MRLKTTKKPEGMNAPPVTAFQQTAKREWRRLGEMKVRRSDLGETQRPFDKAHAQDIASHFDPEAFGFLVVNVVGDDCFVIDGQHRRAGAMDALKPGSEDQKVECLVFYDLTIKQEAALYRRFNHIKHASSYDRFAIGRTAGFEEEVNIDAIVRKRGLRIGRKAGEDGVICCITGLHRIYRNGGGGDLDSTLRICFDAFGDGGLEGMVIAAVGAAKMKHGARIMDEEAIQALASLRGGASAFVSAMRQRRESRGSGSSLTTAGAIVLVERINRQRGSRKEKLPLW